MAISAAQLVDDSGFLLICVHVKQACERIKRPPLLEIVTNWQTLCEAYIQRKTQCRKIRLAIDAWQPTHPEAQKLQKSWKEIFEVLKHPENDQLGFVVVTSCSLMAAVSDARKELDRRKKEAPAAAVSFVAPPQGKREVQFEFPPEEGIHHPPAAAAAGPAFSSWERDEQEDLERAIAMSLRRPDPSIRSPLPTASAAAEEEKS